MVSSWEVIRISWAQTPLLPKFFSSSSSNLMRNFKKKLDSHRAVNLANKNVPQIIKEGGLYFTISQQTLLGLINMLLSTSPDTRPKKQKDLWSLKLLLPLQCKTKLHFPYIHLFFQTYSYVCTMVLSGTRYKGKISMVSLLGSNHFPIRFKTLMKMDILRLMLELNKSLYPFIVSLSL